VEVLLRERLQDFNSALRELLFYLVIEIIEVEVILELGRLVDEPKVERDESQCGNFLYG